MIDLLNNWLWIVVLPMLLGALIWWWGLYHARRGWWIGADNVSQLNVSVLTMLRFLREAHLSADDYRLEFDAKSGMVAIEMGRRVEYLGKMIPVMPWLELKFVGDRILWTYNSGADDGDVNIDDWRITALRWYLNRYFRENGDG